MTSQRALTQTTLVFVFFASLLNMCKVQQSSSFWWEAVNRGRKRLTSQHPEVVLSRSCFMGNIKGLEQKKIGHLKGQSAYLLLNNASFDLHQCVKQQDKPKNFVFSHKPETKKNSLSSVERRDQSYSQKRTRSGG